jgi:hypothetical protein
MKARYRHLWGRWPLPISPSSSSAEMLNKKEARGALAGAGNSESPGNVELLRASA